MWPKTVNRGMTIVKNDESQQNRNSCDVIGVTHAQISRTSNLHQIERSCIWYQKFSEENRPIKLHNFCHMHRCKFLLPVSWACVTLIRFGFKSGLIFSSRSWPKFRVFITTIHQLQQYWTPTEHLAFIMQIYSREVRASIQGLKVKLQSKKTFMFITIKLLATKFSGFNTWKDMSLYLV